MRSFVISQKCSTVFLGTNGSPEQVKNLVRVIAHAHRPSSSSSSSSESDDDEPSSGSSELPPIYVHTGCSTDDDVRENKEKIT